MEVIIFSFLGGIGVSYIFALWRLRARKNRAFKKKEEALKILKSHHMQGHFYLAPMGEELYESDKELYIAISILAGSGYIITDKEKNIVGKFATWNLTSEEQATLRRNMIKIIRSED